MENTYFQKEDSSVAIGYLFHNYRGKGLELQQSPSFNPEIAFSSKGIKSTANDLMKIATTGVIKELEITGYLENDGFSYSLINQPKDKITIIVLSNRRHPVAKEISNSIEAILKDKEYKMPLSRKPFSINSKLLENYSGKYTLNENVSFEVVNAEDSLFVLLGPNKVALIPQSNNQFYMEDNDASMRFNRDSTGIINSVYLLNGFVDSQEKAVRIEK